MQAFAICRLEREKWKGTALPVSYTSTEYYDVSVRPTPRGFEIRVEKQRFETPFTHVPEDGDWPDRLYEDLWEGAEAYGIVEDGKLLAAIEVCPEEWSRRMLVTELFVDEAIRGQGHGRRLMNLAKALTVQRGYRAMILETQSSNVNAVDFYLRQGFILIGLDSCCYTNRDLERKEVRLNLGWFPPEGSATD